MTNAPACLRSLGTPQMPQLPTEILDKEQTYGALAMAHAKATKRGGKNDPPLPIIEPGTAGWNAWARYFIDHLGFEPFAMKRIRLAEKGQMTVPAERPEDFDGSYAPRGN
jgi:hypothetical protein